MDSKLIGFLVGLVALLVAGILFIGFLAGGLGSELKARASAEIKNFADAEIQFSAARKEIDSAVADNPALFAAEQTGQSWNEQLETAGKDIRKVAAARDKLTALLEANKKDTASQVEDQIQALARARQSALAKAAEIQQTVRKLTDFQKELASKLPELQADYDAVQSINLAPVEALVEKAIVDWPEKAVDLNRRLALFLSDERSAETLWKQTEEPRQRARAGEPTGKDVVALLTVATRLHKTRGSLQSSEKQMTALIDQLYWVWDKIIVDMEIQEGQLVTFRQKFQTTRTRVVILPEGKEDEAEAAKLVQSEPAWQTVDKRVYESMKDKLGMSVQHKPAGKFDHEATSLVQPPGYAYIAPVQQHRNHYGYWRHHGGYYHWYYYRPYYRMRSHHWGSSYSPITGPMYDSYDSNRRSGQTYYGSNSLGAPLYGSNGSVTKQNYSSSRFVSSNGFKNTQYAKSGGTYRGSRYAPKASASSSRSTSASRSSSSYRSSSSRSSGSRSSFGGK